jgi:hypothetical protein
MAVEEDPYPFTAEEWAYWEEITAPDSTFDFNTLAPRTPEEWAWWEARQTANSTKPTT